MCELYTLTVQFCLGIKGEPKMASIVFKRSVHILAVTALAFGLAAALYLCITFALVGLFRLAERRWLSFLDAGR